MTMTLGTYLIHATTIGCVAFMLGYGFLAPWWKSNIGRNMMATTFALLLIFGLTSITLIFGTQWPARPWIRIGIAGFACVTVWWRVYILINSQILQRRNPRVEQVR